MLCRNCCKNHAKTTKNKTTTNIKHGCGNDDKGSPCPKTLVGFYARSVTSKMVRVGVQHPHDGIQYHSLLPMRKLQRCPRFLVANIVQLGRSVEACWARAVTQIWLFVSHYADLQSKLAMILYQHGCSQASMNSGWMTMPYHMFRSRLIMTLESQVAYA